MNGDEKMMGGRMMLGSKMILGSKMDVIIMIVIIWSTFMLLSAIYNVRNRRSLADMYALISVILMGILILIAIFGLK
jgi:hypothetical protein